MKLKQPKFKLGDIVRCEKLLRHKPDNLRPEGRVVRVLPDELMASVFLAFNTPLEYSYGLVFVRDGEEILTEYMESDMTLLKAAEETESLEEIE